MLQHIAETTSREALRKRINAFAVSMGDEAFANYIAREIIARTQPHKAIPAAYARYRALVRDGIEFFLSQVNRPRLVELAFQQLQFPSSTAVQERLLELAKYFPTLHKLGQLIARNPHIDPVVKTWLVQLENGLYGTPPEEIREQIKGQLALNGHQDKVSLSTCLLSEASVGAVMRFDYCPHPDQRTVGGVFKVLKPDIRTHLKEELVILEKMAAFFEKNRSRYSVKSFQFLDIFQEVREMLTNEIDVAAEQRFLSEAAGFFENVQQVHIPRVLPLSTDTLTAMTYLKGPKITDVPLPIEQRRQLADVLFEALVCRPLFCEQEQSLFHGDPHAGNIIAVKDAVSGRFGVGLVDWTLAGHLARKDRRKTVQLIQAVIKRDLSAVRRVVHGLAIHRPRDSKATRTTFRQLAVDLTHSSAYDRLSHVKKTFKLLEELSFAGFIFPANLMLFRKSIFALEGVFNDLCPSFDMDLATTKYLSGLITKEIPNRIGNLFFPLADHPETYPSLISNVELQSLFFHQYLDAVGSCYRSIADSVVKSHGLAASSAQLFPRHPLDRS